MILKQIIYAVLLLIAVTTTYIFHLPGNVLISIVMLVAGFYMLIKGADYFVDGSCDLAKKLKIPSLIVGLTIVAMGTSAPELAVSISAAAKGSNSLAISNVIGSNMFNILVVLGVCAAIKPIVTNPAVAKRDYPVNIGATVLFLIFIIGGLLNRWESAILLAALVIYIIVSIKVARKEQKQAEENTPFEFSAVKCALLIFGGIAGIVLGGNLVVEHAKFIAVKAGMSETLVGLTICAVGTSLPELVTSITASKKGENDMAVGNVVGSCLFNTLGILGVSGIITPIATETTALIDCIVLLAITVISYVMYITKKQLSRSEGVTLVVLYIVYMGYIIARNYM